MKALEYDIITVQGKKYIEIWTDADGYIKCPFCNKIHKHGIKGGHGHRLAHCGQRDLKIKFKGITFNNNDGYFIVFTKLTL